MTSRMREQRSTKQIWFWRLARAMCFAFIATVFTIYWPATVGDIYSYQEQDVRSVSHQGAPRYLVGLIGDPTAARQYTPYSQSSLWSSLIPAWGLDVIEYTYGNGDTDWVPEASPLPPWVQLNRNRVGWPVRAAYWDEHLIPGKGNRTQIDRVFSALHAAAGDQLGIERPKWMPGEPYRRVPTQFYVSGLALNVVTFASLWLLPGLILRQVRRWNRVRRGKCGSCGYQLAGIPRCPECGTES